MTDFASVLDALRRPKILVRAARAGLADYRRDRDLRRILRKCGPSGSHTIGSLIDEEARLEKHRTSGEATYCIQRHIVILTALLAEVRLLPETRKAA